jgi:putative copper export protein
MDLWTVFRYLHVLGMAVFVGGQLVLVAAVVPALRGNSPAMREVAHRFAIASAVALAVLLFTGAAMAGHFERWADGTLQLKLGLLVAVGALVGLHVLTPYRRSLSAGILLGSLAIVWLGLRLAHG